MLQLNNEEIRNKLLKLNYKCGPVTDTTRDIHLKKLEELTRKCSDTVDVNLTDEELLSELVSRGQSVAPITATNRHIYLKRLEKLRSSERKLTTLSTSFEGAPEDFEPMEID